MKSKHPPSREARTAPPGVNLEMLLEYLREEGYKGIRASRLRVATVAEFFPNGKPYPYGRATYEGRDVSFRLSHFQRIASVLPDDEPPVIELEDRIWILIGLISPGKEFAVVWGKVDELPTSFMVPSTLKIRLIQWIDSKYRRWRNRAWRSQMYRSPHSIV